MVWYGIVYCNTGVIPKMGVYLFFLVFSDTNNDHQWMILGSPIFGTPQDELKLQTDFTEIIGNHGNAGIPSGKYLQSYGKSPFLMEKTHYKWPFSIAMLVITGGYPQDFHG